MLRYILIILVFLLHAKQSVAQYLTIGGGGVFNPMITQVGFDFRAGIEKRRIGVFADYYHYGAGIRTVSDHSPINEYYITINTRFNIINKDHFKMYVLAGYMYTKWINETDTGPGIYSGVNLGGGVDYRFLTYAAFFEVSTNSVWWEANCHLGIKKYLPMHKIFRGGLKNRYNLDLQNNNSKE